jgi:RNA polymerase sigma factor (sigma-70 family)
MDGVGDPRGTGEVLMVMATPIPTEPAGSQPTDAALVRACADGDRAALGTLYDRYHLDVFRFLSRLATARMRELDDLVQATFIEVLRSAADFRGKSAVKTWLFGIAANVARSQARAEGRRLRHLSVADADLDAPAPSGARPDRTAERTQLMNRVALALERLPHDLRAAFVACEIEELPGPEVARALGIPRGTLYRRVHEARQRIISFVEEGAS